MYSAVILSGGRGNRMAKQVPKQYLLLAGKPMIMHTIERLDCIAEIDEIVIVCEEEFIPGLNLMLRQYGITKDVRYAPAGRTRQESVYNGIKDISNKFVIVHEAARPFVLKKDFLKLVNDLEENVTFGYPIPFTVLKGSDCIEELLNRSELFNVQLPQKFNTEDLKNAHIKAREENRAYTEDAGMLFDICHKRVKILHGNSYNIKITEPIDLCLGEVIYKEYITGDC